MVRQSRENPHFNYNEEDLERWTADDEEVWLLYNANENQDTINDDDLKAYLYP